MRSRAPWTDADLRLLKELVTRNVSLHVIALKLGRSVAAIDSKAGQQGIALQRMKRAYRARARSLLSVDSPANTA